jgi:site-specific DNA recombinase
MPTELSQNKPIKVAYYLRVSTDDQIDRYGIELQKRSLDAIVASRGTLEDGKTNALQLAGEQYIYKDEGVSGTIPLEDRPAFARLQEDVVNAPEGEKPFDIVAVYKIDRFARKLKILLDVIEFFEKYGIKFISFHESIDTSTPFGRAILGIVGVLSELEMETIAMRTRAGKEEAIAKGVFMGKVPPYGYIKDTERRLKVLTKEAEIVNVIFEKFVVERLPLQAICRYLEDNKIESPGVTAVTNQKRKGGISKKSNPFFWATPMIKNILGDEIYLGKYYYHKTKGRKHLPKTEWKLSPYRYEAIVDTITFAKAQTLLENRKIFNVVKHDDKHIYLLSGLLKCACCYDPERDKNEGMQTLHGEPKEIHKGSQHYTYYYKCRRKTTAKTSIRCGSLPLPAEQIEKYVVERLRELLADPKAVFNYQLKLRSTEQELKRLNTDYDMIRRLKNGLPQRKSNLKEQQEYGYITSKELTEKLNALDSQEKKYDGKLAEYEAKISETKLDEGYIKSFEIFEKQYK